MDDQRHEGVALVSRWFSDVWTNEMLLEEEEYCLKEATRYALAGNPEGYRAMMRYGWDCWFERAKREGEFDLPTNPWSDD